MLDRHHEETIAADRMRNSQPGLVNRGAVGAGVFAVIAVALLLGSAVIFAVSNFCCGQADLPPGAAACQPDASPHRCPADAAVDFNGNPFRGGVR